MKKKPKPSPAKVQVTERALLQRLNRHWAKKHMQVKKARARWGNIGRYFMVDTTDGRVLIPDVDIEAQGRQVDVLEKHEAFTVPAPSDNDEAELMGMVRALAAKGNQAAVEFLRRKAAEERAEKSLAESGFDYEEETRKQREFEQQQRRKRLSA